MVGFVMEGHIYSMHYMHKINICTAVTESSMPARSIYEAIDNLYLHNIIIVPSCVHEVTMTDKTDCFTPSGGNNLTISCGVAFTNNIVLFLFLHSGHKRKNYANINIPIQKNPAYEDVKLSRNAAYVPTRPVAASMHTQL